MKRKPETFGDFLRSVLAVRTIGLLSVKYLPKHKLALVALATRSDISGKGRPVPFRVFTEVLEVQDWRTVRRIMDQLVDAQLILPPQKCKAPGVKNNGYMYSWDINLRHPAFPDTYADSPCKNPGENAGPISSACKNQKQDEGSNGSTCKNLRENAGPNDSASKSAGENAVRTESSACKNESIGLQDSNGRPASSEVSPSKNLRENADTALPLQTTLHNQPTTNGGWLVEIFLSKTQQVITISKKHMREIEAHIETHGEPLVRSAWIAFINAAPWNDKTTAHAWLFLDKFPDYLKAGEANQRASMTLEQRMEADPVLAAAMKRSEESILALNVRKPGRLSAEEEAAEGDRQLRELGIFDTPEEPAREPQP